MNWIYCKDRLPDREEKVLVTIMSGEHIRVNIALFIPPYVDTIYGQQKAKWLPISEGNHNNVIAWAELPKPAEVRR